MTSKQLRQKFLDFFEKRGHKIVPSSSLIPTDPSVLFTTAGMQQFKLYYLGEKSPYGQNVASCQKCLRTSDIEEVGDDSHLTFLEMMGNFSFGGYFKEEAIKLAHDFLFKELKLPIEDAIFTVFEGNKNIEEDKESIQIWKKLGVPESKIKKCSKEDNFWGPTGDEGPCGPTTEIHFNGIEVWNLVFNEYYQAKSGKLAHLKQKGVDTGMGLERLAMIAQGKNSVYETDLFSPIINEIPGTNEKAKRIIADHVKSSVFLISEGILPSNVERGYILRRILRRTIKHGKLLNLPKNLLILLSQKVIEIYKYFYNEIEKNKNRIFEELEKEENKFREALENPKGREALKKIFNRAIGGIDPDNPPKGSRIQNNKIRIDGRELFRIYETYGLPIEISQEIMTDWGLAFDDQTIKEAMEEAMKEAMKKAETAFREHQEKSRTASSGMFKGGLTDHSEQTIKYHTATHLLLAALREILNPEIYQKGSNITMERLRFDFNYPEKLNEEQIKKIEDLVNEKIRGNIKVEMIETPKGEALKTVKISFDPVKYGDMVKVYKIDDFSSELCGGPHVNMTGELGRFKIIKEESSGAGIRRIRAILE